MPHIITKIKQLQTPRKNQQQEAFFGKKQVSALVWEELLHSAPPGS